jgi:hypothetical protein
VREGWVLGGMREPICWNLAHSKSCDCPRRHLHLSCSLFSINYHHSFATNACMQYHRQPRSNERKRTNSIRNLSTVLPSPS